MGDDPSRSVKGSEGMTRQLIAVINVKCKFYVDALGFNIPSALQVTKAAR